MPSNSHVLHRTPGAPVNPGAIHRCVLAGFLSQIGTKGENREYVGPRGLRFFLSPGSALFRHEAPWVVVAELVETTKLYARTIGRIRSDWVERVAPDQVEREHFEPHWLSSTGQVAAWERVTLHGLVLVAKRRVPFGPIDPKAARDIFIQEALVDEQIRTDGEFLGANRELIESLEQLEAKRRERTLLADLTTRFDFYDARVPAEIHSTPSFEKWRREAERGNPRLLFMTRADLALPGAGDPAAGDFPDSLEIDGLRLPLDYRHDPGDPEDGITVTTPIAALGRLSVGRLEWLVPGMLREKIVALIRALPKRVRVRFVPSTEYADGAAEALPFAEGPLPQRLAQYLHRLTGTPLSERDFDLGQLPRHLRMNVRVLDADGKEVGAGRDLAALQQQLASKASAAIDATPAPTPAPAGRSAQAVAPAQPAPTAPRERMTRFEVAALPANVVVTQGGMTLPAQPVLEDVGDAVSLRLVPDAEIARSLHRGGIVRLAALRLADDIRPMLGFLPSPDGTPGIDGLALLHASRAPREALERALIDRIAERACFGTVAAEQPSGDPADIRDPGAFETAIGRGRPRLWDAGREVVDLAWRIETARHEIVRTIDAPAPSTWQDAFDDVQEQVASLLPRGFFTSTRWEELVHVPRYLAAAIARLRKLRESGHLRDQRLMAEVRPHWIQYRQRRDALAASGQSSPELDRYRMMIEEFRVSLFAQEFRTAFAISGQRLAKQWDVARG